MKMSTDYPILEFDDNRDAIIEPSKVLKPVDGIPERCVLLIYHDEGTSYHYVSPNRDIAAQADAVQIIQTVLDTHGVMYQIGKTWTTDAIYRETKNRIAKQKSEGCLAVEMECVAFLAVAEFRGVRFGQLLATGDDVSGNEWDPRHTEEHKSFPERLFWLAVEACMKL